MKRHLAINEIFFSIQGESSHAGRPCIFVRTMGCPLRCSYCDTEYAFFEGTKKNFDEIFLHIKNYSPCNLIELTGGEPLAQPESYDFLQELCDLNYEVLLETSGAFPIERVPKKVKIILDVKTPSSKESHRQFWDNFAHLKEHKDEVKFVVGDKHDFEYALGVCEERKLFDRFVCLISPVWGKIALKDLAQWILESKKNFRLQTQMHKYIWGPEVRGV